MNSSNWLSTIGLILDILGVGLIYFNGLSPNIKTGFEASTHYKPHKALPNNKGEKIEQHNKKVNLRSNIGFVLVIVGFLFQLFSNVFS